MATENSSENATKFWTDDMMYKIERPRIELGEADTIRSYMSWMHLYIMGHFNDPVHDRIYLNKLFQYFIVNCPKIREQWFVPDTQESIPMFDSVKPDYVYKGEEIVIEMDEELKQQPEAFTKQSFEFTKRVKESFSTIVDDRKFRKWYMDAKNLISVRIHFGIICLAMFRIPYRRVDYSLRYLNEDLPRNWTGIKQGLNTKYPLFTRRFVEKFLRFGKVDPNMIRRPLRTLLEYAYIEGSMRDFREVFRFTVRLPLRWNGLSLLQYYLALRVSGEFKKIPDWLDRMNDADLNRQLIDIMRYLRKWLDLTGKLPLYYQYSRLFEPEILSEFSRAKNPELASFFAGLDGKKEASASIDALKRFGAFEKYFDLGVKAANELEIRFSRNKHGFIDY